MHHVETIVRNPPHQKLDRRNLSYLLVPTFYTHRT
jgi:hypothetical protein